MSLTPSDYDRGLNDAMGLARSDYAAARAAAFEECARIADAEAAQQLENWKGTTDQKHIEAYRHGVNVLTSLASAIRRAGSHTSEDVG